MFGRIRYINKGFVSLFTMDNKKVQFKMVKASLTDFKFCFRIFEENMKSEIEKNWTWKPETFKQNFKIKEIRIICEKKSGERIGFFQIQDKKDVAYIKELQLASSFQGVGYEEEILRVIEKESDEQKKKSIEVQVFLENYKKEIFMNFGFRILRDLGKSLILEY